MKFTKLTFTILVALIFLSSCSSKYKVDVDITPERVTELKQSIKDYKQEIAEFKPSDDEIIPFVAINEMARAYEELGEYGKAIDLYLSVINEGHSTKALIHNLGRAYEAVGEYDLAVEQYQRIIDEYFDHGYLYDITWAYIRAGNRQGAETYFNEWQLKFRKTDEQVQNEIKKLREAEKNQT